VHVVAATDGSRQSLVAARQFMAFADPAKITEVSVIAVISPLASVPFANELGGPRSGDPTQLSFREEAHAATGVVLAEFEAWGATAVHRRILSGSPAVEIVRAARETAADLIVLASGSGGLSDTILLGSTASRVQHSAPCPVLVSRAKA
jgi:nucleotide-binding universal stress UspA family protein